MQTYTGGCHCGQVRFEVTMELTGAMECNCSYCSKRGFLLTFVLPEQFKLLSGEEAQSEYQFNRKTIHHLFCKTCGVQSFGRGQNSEGKTMYAINVRCLDEVDLSALKITQIDGKSF